MFPLPSFRYLVTHTGEANEGTEKPAFLHKTFFEKIREKY
jgi:hypothetical protein